jgi:hypothetical protein
MPTYKKGFADLCAAVTLANEYENFNFPFGELKPFVKTIISSEYIN